jgi:hypothetical protein
LAGGLLAGVIATEAFHRGWTTLVLSAVVAVVAWFGARRGVPVSRLAMVLFPIAWLVAMVLH